MTYNVFGGMLDLTQPLTVIIVVGMIVTTNNCTVHEQQTLCGLLQWLSSCCEG